MNDYTIETIVLFVLNGYGSNISALIDYNDNENI